MRSESITVTSKTSLSDIQQFASKLDDGMRLRARKVGEGYELYAKDSKPGLWSRITGRSAETRANSRAALDMVFNNAERSFGGPTLDNVRHAMNQGIRSKDVKGDVLKLLIDTIDMQSTTDSEIRLENKGPGLGKLPAVLREQLIRHSKESIQAQLDSGETDPGSVASKLAQVIKVDFDAAQLDPGNKILLTRLGLSSGSRLTYELRKEIVKGTDIADNDSLRQVFERAFEEIAPDLVPNQENGDGTITIDGETYMKVKKLGQGGFGTVDLYAFVDEHTKQVDNSRQVALKFVVPKAHDDMDNTLFKHEAELLKREGNVHLGALGGGNDKVVGFEGAVRMQNGTIGIAIEYAPYGSAADAADAVAQAVSDGHLSEAEARVLRLGLIKDIAEGLAHIHRDKKGFVHFDVKSPNVLVGRDGVGKIADFGLSAKAHKLDLAAVAIPDHAEQVGPELSRYADARKVLEDLPRDPRNHDSENDVRRRAGHDLRALGKRMKGLTTEQRQELQRNVLANVRFNQMRAIEPIETQGIDSWGLGNAAFKMLMGREFSSAFGYQKADRIANFGNDDRAIDVTVPDASRQDWAQRTSGAFAGSTGISEIDQFLNGLLHPDPARRMTIAEAVDHPALSLPGVGSDESRAKLVAVLEGDWNTLQALQAAGQQQQPAHQWVDARVRRPRQHAQGD